MEEDIQYFVSNGKRKPNLEGDTNMTKNQFLGLLTGLLLLQILWFMAGIGQDNAKWTRVWKIVSSSLTGCFLRYTLY